MFFAKEENTEASSHREKKIFTSNQKMDSKTGIQHWHIHTSDAKHKHVDTSCYRSYEWQKHFRSTI